MKRIATGVLLVMLSVVSGAQERPLDRGVSLYREGKFSEAIAYLSALLEGGGIAGREKVQAFLHLGSAYLAVGEKEKAASAFSDLVRRDPAFQPDPVLFPPKVIDGFEQARRFLIGTLEIAGTPPGASVKVSGRIVGLLPFSGDALAGDRALSITLKGYEPHRERIHLAPGGHLALEVHLKPEMPAPAPAIAPAPPARAPLSSWRWAFLAGGVVSAGVAVHYWVRSAEAMERYEAAGPDEVAACRNEVLGLYSVRYTAVGLSAAGFGLFAYAQVEQKMRVRKEDGAADLTIAPRRDGGWLVAFATQF